MLENETHDSPRGSSFLKVCNLEGTFPPLRQCMFNLKRWINILNTGMMTGTYSSHRHGQHDFRHSLHLQKVSEDFGVSLAPAFQIHGAGYCTKKRSLKWLLHVIGLILPRQSTLRIQWHKQVLTLTSSPTNFQASVRNSQAMVSWIWAGLMVPGTPRVPTDMRAFLMNSLMSPPRAYKT